MEKSVRCLSMPSTSSSWTTLRGSLPGEAWLLPSLGTTPRARVEARYPCTGAGEREGGEQDQKEDVGKVNSAGIARRGEWVLDWLRPAEPPHCHSHRDPDPEFSSFSSPWASGWKCSKCDMKENLWLNLTDGSILCGRRYFDGSGGNNHAVEHYRETGYPLAVKLGTITPDGAGTRLPLPT